MPFATNARHRAVAADLNQATETVVARCHTLLRHLCTGDDAPGAAIHDARRIRATNIDVMTLAVLLERERGASWDQVAAYLDEDPTFVRAHYGDLEARYAAGDGIGPVVQGQPVH